jgi:hypothetical protein
VLEDHDQFCTYLGEREADSLSFFLPPLCVAELLCGCNISAAFWNKFTNRIMA